jgi:hypothetical protein
MFFMREKYMIRHFAGFFNSTVRHLICDILVVFGMIVSVKWYRYEIPVVSYRDALDTVFAGYPASRISG